MATIVKTTFQFKRGTAQRWEELNLILAPGEPGFELDTGRLKIGDGKTSWKELEYIGGEGLTDADVYRIVDQYLIDKNLGAPIVGDEASISISGGTASLAGFVEATNFTVPQKQADGVLRWVELPNTRTLIEAPENGALTIMSRYDEETNTYIYTLDYKLPISTSTFPGGVVSAADIEVDGEVIAAANKVYVDETGKMSVKRITTDILQNGEQELILVAGGAQF